MSLVFPKATMALAATPMVAAAGYVAGPYALSYALMNPQGVVDFAEALAPSPPGPNFWGRASGLYQLGTFMYDNLRGK